MLARLGCVGPDARRHSAMRSDVNKIFGRKAPARRRIVSRVHMAVSGRAEADPAPWQTTLTLSQSRRYARRVLPETRYATSGDVSIAYQAEQRCKWTRSLPIRTAARMALSDRLGQTACAIAASRRRSGGQLLRGRRLSEAIVEAQEGRHDARELLHLQGTGKMDRIESR